MTHSPTASRLQRDGRMWKSADLNQLFGSSVPHIIPAYTGREMKRFSVKSLFDRTTR
jgi:hypothetical protein